MSRVIAWAVDASILCLDCGDDPGEDNDGGPVFSTDEHDYPGLYCENCDYEIVEPQTPDGFDSARDACKRYATYVGKGI